MTTALENQDLIEILSLVSQNTLHSGTEDSENGATKIFCMRCHFTYRVE